MVRIPNLPVRTRLFIKRTPWLYRPAKRLTDRRAKGKLCNATTDLCIEGYQSSGNSFSFAILRHANDSLRLAHHCHSVANLQLALNYGVPTVCLIRDPESAISSRVSRFGGDLEDAVLGYVDFYRFALKHIDRLIIVTFEELTQNPQGFLEKLSREIGLDFPLENVEELKEWAIGSVREWSEKRGNPDRISLPLESRGRTKARIQQDMRNCRYFPDAIAIWQQIMQRVKP